MAATYTWTREAIIKNGSTMGVAIDESYYALRSRSRTRHVSNTGLHQPTDQSCIHLIFQDSLNTVRWGMSGPDGEPKTLSRVRSERYPKSCWRIRRRDETAGPGSAATAGRG